MTIKHLLLAAAVLVIPSMVQAANQLPTKFWGDWVEVDGSPAAGYHIKLTGTTVSFGSEVCKFTSIELANEESTAFEVTWHCPGQVSGVQIKAGFRLTKIWGKEALVSGGDSPTNVSIYQRARR
jgi:hypothetical protein